MATRPIALDVARLRRAHKLFQQEEPRNLFYRAATFLVDRALEGQSELTLAESLAVLLQTWNAQFYRFRGGFRTSDLDALQGLLDSHLTAVLTYRLRRLEGSLEAEAAELTTTFTSFERKLGPVGSAKTLHLLAPTFYPLWDRAIARAAYRLNLNAAGGGAAPAYLRLMRAVAQ